MLYDISIWVDEKYCYLCSNKDRGKDKLERRGHQVAKWTGGVETSGMERILKEN